MFDYFFMMKDRGIFFLNFQSLNWNLSLPFQSLQILFFIEKEKNIKKLS